MPSSLLVLIAVCRVGRWNSKLGVDLVEGCLGGREAELTLEQGRLGRIAIGTGKIESLGGINKLLCFLDNVGQV